MKHPRCALCLQLSYTAAHLVRYAFDDEWWPGDGDRNNPPGEWQKGNPNVVMIHPTLGRLAGAAVTMRDGTALCALHSNLLGER
jgi:hypothetical protein